MGTILSSKAKREGKVVFEILLNYQEAIQLQGHMENVLVFSENNSNLKAKISSRGKDSLTKYLLVPKSVRDEIKFDKEMTCQRVDMDDKIVLIYTIQKYRK